MITPAIRAAVSIASLSATLSAPLALGACTHGAPPVPWDAAAAIARGPLTIRFENEAQTHVDVYFVDDRREWWLGRVAPGASTTLRIPDDAILQNEGYVRLAVLANSPRTAQVARNPRALLTIAQPARSLLAQRWTFVQTESASPEVFGLPTKRR